MGALTRAWERFTDGVAAVLGWFLEALPDIVGDFIEELLWW